MVWFKPFQPGTSRFGSQQAPLCGYVKEQTANPQFSCVSAFVIRISSFEFQILTRSRQTTRCAAHPKYNYFPAAPNPLKLFKHSDLNHINDAFSSKRHS
jgi:hypothetical protein